MKGGEIFMVITPMLIISIYSLYWMVSMLKTVKEQRVLISTLLIAIKKIAEKQDVDIDLQKISNEVINKM